MAVETASEEEVTEQDAELDPDMSISDQIASTMSFLYPAVEDFAGAVRNPQDYHGFKCDHTVQAFLDEALVDSSTYDADDEDQLDKDEYITHLEQALFILYRQFHLLMTCDWNAGLLSKCIGKGVVKPYSDALVLRMVMYCLTGKDLSYVNSPQRFNAPGDFEMMIAVQRLLPDELRERAAEWIEVLSANYYNTETYGAKLPTPN